MAVSRASSDWLIHPSLVFKTFEESLIKSPFSYGNSSHIVPEKIVESFVDQNGIRCYRVKWLDSWLTEQHVTAAFPHLITEYWINKPINDTNVDYQNYIVQGQGTGRTTSTLGSLSLPAATTASNATPAKAAPLRSNSAKPLNVSDSLQQISQQEQQQTSSTISIAQLFNSATGVTKEEEISCASSSVEHRGCDSPGETDFSVRENEIELTTEKSNIVIDKPESSGKGENVNNTNETQSTTLPEIPKISESETSMVFLFDKNSNYAGNNNPLTTTTGEKAIVAKMQAVPTFNPHFKNHISFPTQHAIRLPSMEQINQHPHMSGLVTVEVTPIEKKPITKKTLTKQAKAPKEKQPVVCDICGKTISSRKNLRVHKTVKHFKNGSFACQICGRKFALNRDLKRHMPLHTNERKYECPHCGLQCKQPGHLTKHIRTHTEVMNWRCDCCFKNFKVQADLKKHCFTEHADISKENLTCSVCKEKLKLPNSVYLHSLRHSGVREFQCHICKASFKLKQHMQVHMKTHEKPKDVEKIVCPICNREFRFKHTYEKHFSKHVEKTKEEYEENKRVRLEEKQRRQEKKASGEVKGRKKKASAEDESLLSASDSEEAKNPHKRKLRRPEKVLYDKDFKTTKVMPRDKEHILLCEICGLTFNSSEQFETHIREVHKNGKVSFIQNDQFIPPNASSIPMESQMVMLKLPEPISMNSESGKLTHSEVSSGHASVINALAAMQGKEHVMNLNRLAQLEHPRGHLVDPSKMRMDMSNEHAMKVHLMHTQSQGSSGGSSNGPHVHN